LVGWYNGPCSIEVDMDVDVFEVVDFRGQRAIFCHGGRSPGNKWVASELVVLCLAKVKAQALHGAVFRACTVIQIVNSNISLVISQA